MFPTIIFLLFNIHCEMTDDMTALEDCLGPKVLNGLIITTGKLKRLMISRCQTISRNFASCKEIVD